MVGGLVQLNLGMAPMPPILADKAAIQSIKKNKATKLIAHSS
jgi:hypothetical protein